jgi:predicted Rossmann-fold nucleotide-binding protein
LYEGFTPEAPHGFASSFDYRVYRHFVDRSPDEEVEDFRAMMRALHDHSISDAASAFLRGRRCAAIMGGHKMRRDGADYRRVARLGAALRSVGFLVATGGGPGAMEAGHLGALSGDWERIVDRLAAAPALPDNLLEINHPDPAVSRAKLAELQAWFAPAYWARLRVDDPGESIAVPTWHYGHEPTTVFASHIAKYFQNSIREDGLLAIAHYGIVYTPGRAGTLQEIFQDAAQNYYKTVHIASPMVFLGRTYWTETLPVAPLLKSLFANTADPRLLFTDSVEEAVAFLIRLRPVLDAELSR